MSQLPPDILSTALRIADVAGQAILPHFRNLSGPEDNKRAGGYDPVTVADRAAEEAMRTELARLRPQDAILGEEFGRQTGSSGLTWVLDPIDGTRGFVAGTPTWGTLIAVSDANGPLLGIIDQPYIGERFVGTAGAAHLERHGARHAIRTRAPRPLSEAVLFTTFPEVGSTADRKAFEAVADQVKLVRYGMDCYAYALLAAGQIDLVIEAGLQPYDIQAPIALIAAAGGRVTDWRGGPAHHGGHALAAANPEIHAAAIGALGA